MNKVGKFVLIALILSVVLIISQKNNLVFWREFFSKEKDTEVTLVDDFVTYSMIRYFGIYTLFGIKPVTEVDAQYIPPTEEQRREIYEGLSSQEKEDTPYDSFIVSSPWGVSTKTQWKAFKRELRKLKLQEHFFLENRYNYEDDEFNSILFVHEPSLIRILERYHSQFAIGTGEDFNPIDKVRELKNGGSKFWDKIFKEKNHYLMGIVFGFGEKNSKYFQLETDGDEMIRQQRVDHTTLDEVRNLFKDDVSVIDMCLPSFVSYPINGVDEVVESYSKNKETIIDYMKDKDLTQEVLRILDRGVEAIE